MVDLKISTTTKILGLRVWPILDEIWRFGLDSEAWLGQNVLEERGNIIVFFCKLKYALTVNYSDRTCPFYILKQYYSIGKDESDQRYSFPYLLSWFNLAVLQNSQYKD